MPLFISGLISESILFVVMWHDWDARMGICAVFCPPLHSRCVSELRLRCSHLKHSKVHVWLCTGQTSLRYRSESAITVTSAAVSRVTTSSTAAASAPYMKKRLFTQVLITHTWIHKHTHTPCLFKHSALTTTHCPCSRVCFPWLFCVWSLLRLLSDTQTRLWISTLCFGFVFDTPVLILWI